MDARRLLVVVVMAVIPLTSAEDVCHDVRVLNRGTRDYFREQPTFLTFVPMDDGVERIDSMCYTEFPVPGDPFTYNVYESIVYKDGSTKVTPFICTEVQPGVIRVSNPDYVVTEYIFAYAGCETYLVYVCKNYGMQGLPLIHGACTGQRCQNQPLSCLKSVHQLIADAGLPRMEFYRLPMKLPHRCVTQQASTIPINPLYDDHKPVVFPAYH